MAMPFELAAKAGWPKKTCCNSSENECSDGWKTYAGLALLSVAAGALAGWGTAECINKKGSRGDPGMAGKAGPAGAAGSAGATGATGGNFVIDDADILTATVDVPAIFTGAGVTGASIQTVVSAPDGGVFYGEEISLLSLPQTMTFPTITPVVSGTYEYVLRISGNAFFINLSPDNLQVFVHSESLAQTTTILMTIPGVTVTTNVEFTTQYTGL